MIIIGIDPGQSGGIAFVDTTSDDVFAIKMPETESDLVDEIGFAYKGKIGAQVAAYLEKVGPMPKQGVVSVFKFGQGYGMLRGVLAALGIRRTFVRPQEWQKELRCLTGGNKNISKARAQELFPKLKITHALADALLIAEYGRRMEMKGGS